MARRQFDPKQDQRNIQEYDKQTNNMCRANGCPRWWSIHLEGQQPLCSSHAWSNTHEWPAVTQRLLDVDAELAYHSRAPETIDKPHKDTERIRAIMAKLQATIASKR